MEEEAYVEMEAWNNILKAQTMELADPLKFMNSILKIVDEVDDNGESFKILQIMDPLFISLLLMFLRGLFLLK